MNKNLSSDIRRPVILAALLLTACSLWAGDTAVFVDLGFSSDGRTYMFGQYGVQSGTLRPWAEVSVVDVASNSYVPGGKVTYTHDSSVTAGHDGSGALFRVIARNTALADRYNIGFLFQGQPLYVNMENGVSTGFETVEFRDFEKAASFRASLRADYSSAAGSSFTISLERRNSDGSSRTYTVGNGGIKRPGIVSYRIRRVLAAPRNGALIFVIEMKKQDSGDIRYMVETIKL
jgi:predicted secreted protein